MNLFDNNAVLYDDDTSLPYKGINSYRIAYSQDEIALHPISPEQQFRPDKICDELYDDPTLTWLLDDLNNFKHGIKEYLPNKNIKYLKRETLVRNGILK